MKAKVKVIAKGDIVIYEPTAYPGATEEVCIPQIEQYSSLVFKLSIQAQYSSLVFNQDFFAGYSP